MNRLLQITAYGQSIWLDFTRRSFVTSGDLKKLIVEDGFTGVTSNPAIFDEAISSGDDYDDAIRLAAERNASPEEAYADIVVEDIQSVADELDDVFFRTEGRDGYVSLEVSPLLAYDTQGTIRQARELWERVARPNLFIKIPATEAGLPAIRETIAAGINVNITLLFDHVRYRAVAEAYLAGLNDRFLRGVPIDRVASVASFFLSRIDQLVDPRLEEISRRRPELATRALSLHGQSAIACAKQAYQIYKDIFATERFRLLAAVGARPQRLLWASTSTKNPGERDVRYVEALIGPETINTIPLKTIAAFRDHGEPAFRLEEDLESAQRVLNELDALGIDLQQVGQELEAQGVKKFVVPFNHLHEELRRKLGSLQLR